CPADAASDEICVEIHRQRARIGVSLKSGRAKRRRVHPKILHGSLDLDARGKKFGLTQVAREIGLERRGSIEAGASARDRRDALQGNARRTDVQVDLSRLEIVRTVSEGSVH